MRRKNEITVNLLRYPYKEAILLRAELWGNWKADEPDHRALRGILMTLQRAQVPLCFFFVLPPRR